MRILRQGEMKLEEWGVAGRERLEQEEWEKDRGYKGRGGGKGTSKATLKEVAHPDSETGSPHSFSPGSVCF